MSVPATKPSPPIEAVVLRSNLEQWLRCADLSNPGVLAKLRRMDRLAHGRDEGKQATIAAVLRAARGLPAEHPGVAVMFMNCLIFENVTEVRARLDDESVRRLIRRVAQGRGRVKGARSDKHGEIAGLLSRLLDDTVSSATVAKVLKTL